MAIKPFAIQGSDLTLGGVNLQAGTTGVVIPGVTQAVNYRAEEVERRITIGGNNPNTFGSNTNLVYVMDNAEYVYQSGGAQPSQEYVPAEYSVDELDDGRIEEVDVESGGTFAAADKTRVEAADMWAIQHALGEDPLDPFVAGDWTQIPFRPKMRAGVVENVGGGGNANTGNFTFSDDTIENNNDASIEVVGGSLGNIEVNDVDELVPPGGVWRLFISDEDYPTLGTTVQIGDTVTTSWGTPITATITDIVQDSGDWQIHVAQDITAGFDDFDNVTFNTVVTTKTWTFGQDGSLTLPNGMSIDSYGTSGGNAVVSIGGDDTRITIDNDGAPPGLTITTNATAGMGQKQWRFGPDGDLTFPDGSIQTTAYTSSGAVGTFFVVANEDGRVSKSTDGVSWTTGVDTGASINRVATDGVTVAMIQSDQLSWTTFAGLESSTYVSGSSSISDKIGDRTINWRQIDYAGGYFVAVGRYTPTGSTLSQGVYGYSTDGRVWAFETVDQTVVEYFGNDPVDSDWEFSDIDYNGVGWMFSVGDDEGAGIPQGGGVYITDLTATITSARCFSMSITYDASWNGSAWYMEGDNSIAGVNVSIDPRNGTFDGPVDPWATDIQDLGIGAGGTNELAGGNGYIAASDSEGHVAWSDDNGVTWQIVTPIPYTRTISAITQASPAVVSFSGSGETGGTGEKVIISGSSVSGYNGTFYWNSANNSLYTDQARTTPFDTSGLAPFTGTATLTWSHGMFIDAMDYINGYFYIGNDDEQIVRTTNFVSWTIVDDQNNNFDYWNDIAGFVNTGGDIGDIVVEEDSEYTKLTLANKDFTLETTRTGTQDADINLFAADDIFIEARGDDIALSAKDQVRINTRSSFDGPGDDRTWTFDREGRIRFPDDTFQTTAYPGSDVWVQEFKTSLGSQVDVPVMTTSVEYLGGGDIVALIGHSNNIGNGSYSGVARFTSAGELVWSMSFTGALYTTGWGLAVDNANGYIYVAGNSNVGGAAYDVATLTKLNQTDGSEVWSCAYDVGVANTNTVVDVASDGSPVVVGFVETPADDQVVTSKINAVDGSVTWSRAIDGQGDENAYGMAVGPTGEIVTVGYMDQFGISDAALTLYTVPASNPNWVTTATVTGGSGATYNVSFTGGVPTFTNIVDPIGGRIVDSILDTVPGASIGGETGMDDMIVKVGTVSDEPDDRMLIVKYNSAGAIQWQKAVQVVVGYDCTGADADIDSEGNIYVCGNYDNGGGQAMIIIKFNSQGVKQWTRQLTGDCGDFATSIVVGPDNFLYLSAVTVNITNTNVNMVIAKYDRDGDVEWQRLLSNTTNAVFAGEFFINNGGGSNLAVKDGYVAVGGGFGDIENFPFSVPNAIVAQVGSHGAEFLAGNFEFEVAGFSGNLDSTASNITVVDAGKTDSDFTVVLFLVSDFNPTVDLTSDLIGTLYHGNGGENRLFNSGQSLILETTGAVTLPKGGTITEGVVTSNPTIQLTPARPDVASQKLVIKGGAAPGFYVVNNNIQLEWSDTTAIVGDTVNFTIVDSTTYANQTLYWWIYPENAGIGDSNFGTVAIDNNGDGAFSILIDSDDYEFTVRVSPENNNYDPDNLGVESYPINASEPTYPDYHLHLTTGNLAETSIFLGTDNHNVRTTVNGGIEINTPGIVTVDGIVLQGTGYTDGSYTAQATTGGSGTGLTVDYLVNTNQVVTVTINQQGVGYNNGDVITIPGGSSSATVLLEVNANNVWAFGTDGDLTLPAGGDIVDSTGASVLGGGTWPVLNTTGSSGPQNIAIGENVHQTFTYTPGFGTVAVGYSAGQTNQGGHAVAIGWQAGQNNQSNTAIAIGYAAGQTGQEDGAVAIGAFAGNQLQGVDAIAIGKYAGYNGVGVAQPDNTIFLNATGTNMGGVPAQTSSFYVAPIRNASGTSGVLQYNTSTKEVSYSNTITVNTSTWTFGTDGKLAKLNGLTLTAGGQFNICTIVTGGSGYNTGSALKATTGGSGTGMTVGIGYGLSNQLTNVDVVDPGTGYVDGDVITVSEGTGGTFTITRYNNQANQGNNNTVEFDWTFGTNGRLTLPGALVKSTVAKTGAINPGIDKVATVSIEPTYDATWNASYSVSVGGFSCDINFPSAGNPEFVNIVDTVGNRTVGATLATVLGSDLGITGVNGVNDMVIKVATLTTTIATALDLTKSVNKLTNGDYTLANGVEGQIMYLVRQTGSTAHTVTVANARDNGTTYTDVPFTPFIEPGPVTTNMATLIFTDGAWQSMGGFWSFT